MSAHRAEFSISAMCRVLRVSRSGYYAWLRRPALSRWQRADTDLAPHIMSIHEASRGVYGAPRVQAELRSRYRCEPASYYLINVRTKSARRESAAQ